MARTITIDPGKELGGFVDGLVEAGSYKTTSEVVRAGLRLLQEQAATSKLQQLRALLDEGENSGVLVDWDVDKFLSRMKTKRVGKNL
ncbi:MAG TPA: type II toxin-antitoxin system ParD family antitoxin [Pseudomonadales bacterium]|nr:type II toxin-antitoxin system ParD family antitoxin [Pseudomonadales bacterium]